MEIEMRRRLHVLSSGKQSQREFVEIAKVIHPYVDFLHLREKMWTGKELIMTIEQLIEAGVPLRKLYINDRADIAFMKEVRGVQIGYQSAPISTVKEAFPSLKIGASVHTLQEAQEAYDQGADFLVYGNVYPTSSKPGRAGTGISNLEKLVQTFPIPTIAIGGITPDRVRDVVETGAKGIAVLSGIFLSKDPLEAARSYYKELHQEVE